MVDRLRTLAQDVKSIEQDARALMRKHGLRFGQYTLFMPALLKPAPTRLRIMLWGIAQGLDDIPAPPPPGVVTFPAPNGAPDAYFQMAGYRKAGDRALRLDMLERLADMTRGLDARKGFEATPDMLSITGLTLDQFASLMDGLGYRAEKAERPKVKPASVPVPDAEAEAKAAVEAAGEPGEPLPVDAVVDARNGGAALDLAPAATAEAEGDTAAIEAVETAATDVDQAAERPVAAPAMDADTTEAFATGTPGTPAAPEPAAPEPAGATDPLPEPEAIESGEDMPRPLDAVISEDTPGDALDDAPAATAYAASDTAAIEAVEQGATDVDQAPERPAAANEASAVTDDGAVSASATEPSPRDAAPRVEDTDEPMAAMSQPSSVPKEAEGKQVKVAMADVETGEMETFYTFRILPRGRRQRGDGNRDGERGGQRRTEGGGGREVGERKRQPRRDGKREGPKTEGGTRPDGNRDGQRKQGGKGKPRGGKPGQQDRAPKREYFAAPARASKPMDPDSPFAILQKLKDGK